MQGCNKLDNKRVGAYLREQGTLLGQLQGQCSGVFRQESQGLDFAFYISFTTLANTEHELTNGEVEGLGQV